MSNKISTDKFIKKANIVHKCYYDYSKVEFKNIRTKIIIICPKHGEFLQRVDTHLNGSGCRKCYADSLRKSNKWFVQKVRDTYGDKYDYSIINYINARKKVKIMCKEHGIFSKYPNNLLNGSGCNKCRENLLREKTEKELIRKYKDIHGDKYGYSEVKYSNSTTKIKIICPSCGIFEQLPYSHLNGYNCPKCLNPNRYKNTFIKKAKKIYGNKYDYSNINYINSGKQISIKCKLHGIFLETPKKHLKGHECPKCVCENNDKKFKYYIIYKTTNIINDKYYIGQHCTNDINDNYIGSGTLLKRAIKKYGKENFKCERLFIFDNFEDMNNKEIELVNEDFINEIETYNLVLGGGKYYSKNTKGVKNQVTVRDKNNKIFNVSINDPRYISGEYKHIHKDIIHINNGKERKSIHKNELEKYLEKGWKGGTTIDKSKIWICKYDSEIEITANDYLEYKQQGWIKGSLKDRSCITNGTSELRVINNQIFTYLNNGWKLGRLNLKKKCINKNDKELRVPENQLSNYLNDGWSLGRAKFKRSCWKNKK